MKSQTEKNEELRAATDEVLDAGDSFARMSALDKLARVVQRQRKRTTAENDAYSLLAAAVFWPNLRAAALDPTVTEPSLGDQFETLPPTSTSIGHASSPALRAISCGYVGSRSAEPGRLRWLRT